MQNCRLTHNQIQKEEGMQNEKTLLLLQFSPLNTLKPWNKTRWHVSLPHLFLIPGFQTVWYWLSVFSENHSSLLPSDRSNYPIIESMSRCTFKYCKYHKARGWVCVIMLSLSWEGCSSRAPKITSTRQPSPCLSVIQAQLNRKQLTWLLLFSYSVNVRSLHIEILTFIILHIITPSHGSIL